MFERRLKIALGAFALALGIIAARLAQLQIVRADAYRREAEAMLLREPESLPFVRGRILDRLERELVHDAPCWDIRVDYAVLVLDERRITEQVRRARQSKRYPAGWSTQQVREALLAEVERMWWEIAKITAPLKVDVGRAAREVADLKSRGAEIVRRVNRIRTAVAQRRGYEIEVEEERSSHAIATGLSADQQIEARQLLSTYPWVHVASSRERVVAEGAEEFAHLLGRMGRVDAEDLEQADADDLFGRYRADELKGISGVEQAAERILRGRRGRQVLDREGNIVEWIEPQDGQDVHLTIRGDLQKRMYERLGDAVRSADPSRGGAIVVVDVDTREVLALVSYPAYDPPRFAAEYEALRDDTTSQPLRFRAVSNAYPPGSVVKPLVALAGLMKGVIDLSTTQSCTGYMFEEIRDRWRCWDLQGSDVRMAHGEVNVVEALRGSCNIFMYRLGETLGVDGLCSYFDMVGVGQDSGLGLTEESRGINPTPSYLAERLNRAVTRAHGRLFAIGQGELEMTPVQVANLAATYASGKYARLRLLRGGEDKREWILPAKPEHLRAIRQGMYEVVNDPTGTAYKYARLEDERYVLCGKTGSAQAYAQPTHYRVQFKDSGGRDCQIVVAASHRAGAVERVELDHPGSTITELEVEAVWPFDPGYLQGEPTSFAHAWFAGFLQPRDADGSADWSRDGRIAFAVLVEYGGSGGHVAGPLAKQVAADLIEILGPALDAELQDKATIP